MVAKVVTGKNIRAALHYNEQKVKEGKAECLEAAHYGCEAHQLSFAQKLRRFELLAQKNARVKTNAVHISLNFAPGEQLDKTQLREIAGLYLDRIGFGEQPYLLYQHFDAAHPHVHLVTTNLREDGSRIDLHNLGRTKSEAARKEIEERFGLVRAAGKRAESITIQPVNLEKVRYGETQTQRAISQVARGVTRTYQYTSLAELNAVLSLYGVTAYRGKENSPMFQNRGLVYSLLDDQGQRVGIPIKASAITGKPTLSKLEKQFALHQVLRRPHGSSLKARIDAVMNGNPANREAFTELLTKEGISALFRENGDGRPYGVTFVDHRTHTVFKGSDLGSAYSVNGLMERLGKQLASLTPTQKNDFSLPTAGGLGLPKASYPIHQTQKASNLQAPSTTSPLEKLLQTEGNAGTHQTTLPKRKKKKKRRLSL